MSTKVPIYLKRGSRKGKKEKLRDLLSSDMISPPLGDFRHTIHIGSGGGNDTFGDISFLQGKFHLLPGTAMDETQEDSGFEMPFQFTRTATLCGRELPDGPSSCRCWGLCPAELWPVLPCGPHCLRLSLTLF